MSDAEEPWNSAREKIDAALAEFVADIDETGDKLASDWALVLHASAPTGEADEYHLIGSREYMPLHIVMGLLGEAAAMATEV